MHALPGLQGPDVKTWHTLSPIAAAILVSTMSADAPNAEEAAPKLSPQALREFAPVEAEIDRLEEQAIERLAAPRIIRFSKSNCSGR
jgi:hypothetical protein